MLDSLAREAQNVARKLLNRAKISRKYAASSDFTTKELRLLRAILELEEAAKAARDA